MESLLNLKKYAFTLAEVLITLGIIGVVAAITIPGLVTQYKKIRTVTILKESYSIMQQAMKLSQEDNGETDSWDTSLNGHDFFHQYLANYLKWNQEYTLNELNTIAPHYQLDGNPYSGDFFNNPKSAHFSLINGSLISTVSHTQDIMLAIDVNGISKPNKLGIDYFFFIFTPEHGLRPWGDKGTELVWSSECFGEYSRSKVMNSTPYGCNIKSSGKWCTALIMQDGWKISNDYPWK